MLEFSGKDSYWGNSKEKKKKKHVGWITKSLLGIVLYERLLSLSLSLSLSLLGGMVAKEVLYKCSFCTLFTKR